MDTKPQQAQQKAQPQAENGTMRVNVVGSTMEQAGFYVSLKSKITQNERRIRKQLMFIPMDEFTDNERGGSLLKKRSRQ